MITMCWVFIDVTFLHPHSDRQSWVLLSPPMDEETEAQKQYLPQEKDRAEVQNRTPSHSSGVT